MGGYVTCRPWTPRKAGLGGARLRRGFPATKATEEGEEAKTAKKQT